MNSGRNKHPRIAGPEFGEKEGHIFVINKALYGLKTSGKRWHERFTDVLRDMGFHPARLNLTYG